MKPMVAIVGRPNVGKSTFFNQVTRSRDALVDDLPGVTRDRIYGDALWNDIPFTLVDTGGFSGQLDDAFADAIRHQVYEAMEAADAIIMLMDGRQGLSPYDRDIVDTLRDQPKPVFFAVNKIDGPEQEALLAEFFALGIAHLFPLSAEHRFGLSDLLDRLVANFKPHAETSRDEIRLAVVGRPNVGKSSLLNRLVGAERHLVSDIPGTTRDAVDSLIKRDGRHYRLIDTAGIRRKGKVTRKLEKFSILKALRSLDRCDVALIVIDAAEGVTDQDISVAGYAHERGCGCVFLLNKWDLVAKDQHSVRRFTQELRTAAKFLAFAPVLTLSALTGQRVQRIFKLVDAVHAQYTTRLNTGRINRILEQALADNEPSLHRGRRIKFFYATQAASRPPTFVMFVNYPEAVHFSYQRYLVNRLREGAGLHDTPIRLLLRPRAGRRDIGVRPKRRERSGRKRRRSR
ncbi:MAG: ribosome biogenesis GTPase Der [Desulfobacterales bacterium]|nr:ribosome biogenesis GTPase Der [Desulfobacterales bacterium]MDJ0888176.1 ribosome biogenesis GTPase Der [Desulfobacterales bacterium]MDJ0990293.1 ribosome biogenesis GTPase Der [Desulfobacterales bacterium]